MLQFFMEPGKTTEIYVNLREASRRKSKFHSEGKPYGEMVYINGPLETVAQELNGNHLSIDMQDKLYQNMLHWLARILMQPKHTYFKYPTKHKKQ